MVCGVDIIEIDIACLIYNPMLSCNSPKFASQRSSSDRVSPEHDKWFRDCLDKELRWAGSKCKLMVNHWTIFCGCVDIFTINGKLYPNLTIIFGQTLKHWAYSNKKYPNQLIHGNRLRFVYGEEHYLCRKCEFNRQIPDIFPSPSDLWKSKNFLTRNLYNFLI